MMMMMKMKKVTEQTASFADFLFSVSESSKPRIKYQWSLKVKIRSSKQSGKHMSSFSQYSKGAKVVAAIFNRGQSYLVTLPRY